MPLRRRGSVSKPKQETENIAVVVRVNGKPLEKSEKSELQYDNEKTVQSLHTFGCNTTDAPIRPNGSFLSLTITNQFVAPKLPVAVSVSIRSSIPAPRSRRRPLAAVSCLSRRRVIKMYCLLLTRSGVGLVARSTIRSSTRCLMDSSLGASHLFLAHNIPHTAAG